MKNGKDAVGKKILIDGQQRITALMTAIAGRKILTENYKEKVIRIAFNPLTKEENERFAVQTAVHLKSKEWIADISEPFKAYFSPLKFLRKHLQENPESSVSKIASLALFFLPQVLISKKSQIFLCVSTRKEKVWIRQTLPCLKLQQMKVMEEIP